jgi:ABC-type nickel/cobalt efflux system permease component RcnA
MSTQWFLILWSGLAAGSLHVVSGADHLAALLPLSVGQRLKAFRLGVRWGFGHSGGVLLIGLLAVSLKEWVDFELIGEWGERLVGVMLVAIGAWGMRHGVRLTIHAHPHVHEAGGHAHLHVHTPRGAEQEHDVAVAPSRHGHAHTAFLAGTLHGVAGTAHILGVLPAVALSSWLASGLYLVAFALGTVAAMATFAALVGEGSARASADAPRLLRRLTIAAGALTMLVGLVWIIMPALGYAVPALG